MRIFDRLPVGAGTSYFCGLLLCLSFSLSSSATAQTIGADSDAYARGRVLISPRPGLPETELAKIVGEHGGKARKIGQSGVYIVDLPANASEKAVAQRLANNPHLKFAELDRRVSPAFAVNDPYAGSEWHLGKIGAPLAWDVAQGAGVTIAILDSGVDT